MNRIMIFLVSYFALLTFAPAQGPLAPPGGPAPMMRSLDQLEPRTPITSLPFTIFESGSYYVAGPLISTNHGIVIHANDVTVDLMGFTISGSNNTNFYGIFAQGGVGLPLRNVHIRNGGVRGFGEGVRVESVNGGSIRWVTAIQNVGVGIGVWSGPGGNSANFAVEHCESISNGGWGINISSSAAQRGMVARHNYVWDNYHLGFRLVGLQGAIVTDNIVGPQKPHNDHDESIAIFAFQSPRLFIARNVSIDNTSSFSLTHGGVRGPTVGKESGTLSDTGIESHPHANFHIRPD